jgi:two-component system NtrC family sensor kinase
MPPTTAPRIAPNTSPVTHAGGMLPPDPADWLPIAPASRTLSAEQVEELLRHFEQVEERFQKVRDGLTHSHRLTTLGTIASMIAHEYNNILTPIISYAQLALGRPDDGDAMRKAVEKALAGAERAAAISSSLLGFAREHDLELVADVPTVIRDTIACFGRDPQKDGITLVIDAPPARVNMSPLNLQQVLLNLVLNAKKAMRRRGGTLTITGRQQGGDVVLEVRDTGPGIPPAVLDRLFEPFVTHRIGDDDDPGTPRGTGLGLCICRDLLRAAGGGISAASTPAGATFTLRIPLTGNMLETT